MIGAEEMRKLMSQYRYDPIYPLIAVLKCLAAVVVLVIIAAGPWAFLTVSNPAGSDAKTARQTNAALAESKRVFDARRHAYEAARQRDKLDSATSERVRLAVD